MLITNCLLLNENCRAEDVIATKATQRQGFEIPDELHREEAFPDSDSAVDDGVNFFHTRVGNDRTAWTFFEKRGWSDGNLNNRMMYRTHTLEQFRGSSIRRNQLAPLQWIVDNATVIGREP